VTADLARARFDARVESLGPLRRMVTRVLEDWGCESVLDDAVLCASELASNAILHARVPFDVTILQVNGGVRIEVADERPHELPAVVPPTGSATDITSQSTTGRGLQIVAAVSDRWGVTATDDEKSVWAELRPGGEVEPTQPVTVADTAPPPGSTITLELLSMPVRESVASGMHLDGVVRELQLAAGDEPDTVLDQLYELLDASAPVRLEGRREALRAAGEDQRRYDLTLHTSWDALRAVRRLNDFIEGLPIERRTWRIPPAVAAFRAWLEEETARQLRGHAPRPCTLG